MCFYIQAKGSHFISSLTYNSISLYSIFCHVLIYGAAGWDSQQQFIDWKTLSSRLFFVENVTILSLSLYLVEPLETILNRNILRNEERFKDYKVSFMNSVG